MPDVRTVYVAGLFTVVIVCLIILAIPTTQATDRVAVTAIGSAAMGVLSSVVSSVLGRLPGRKDPPNGSSSS